MIWTVFQISALRLWNNKQEVLLTLLVPILFFSIFALIFTRGIGQGKTEIAVSFVDDDRSELTQRVIQAASLQPSITSATGVGQTAQDWPIDRLSRTLISRVDAGLVVYFPKGFSDRLRSQVALPVRLMDEGTNPVGKQIVQAVLTQALASEMASDVAPRPGMFLASTTLARPQRESAAAAVDVDFEDENVFAYNKHHPKIAMYAAGIAVMFLLFSANGAGGSLLEEKEAGTLERLLSSQLNVTQLLLGKWLFITALGVVQLVAMFAWGQVAFGVDFVGHLVGFFVLAVPTAGAGASFALFLASLCRTRNQLNGISVILVLSMSALGGSMVPRYIMSESMQRLGKLTFNGWALDGFKKIFWYDLPASAVRTEVLVLCGIAILFGLAARLFAPRWSVN